MSFIAPERRLYRDPSVPDRTPLSNSTFLETAAFVAASPRSTNVDTSRASPTPPAEEARSPLLDSPGFQAELFSALQTVSTALGALKPVNLVTLLCDFFSSPSLSRACNSCVRFLELYDCFWGSVADITARLSQCISTALLHAYKAFEWFRNLLKSLLPSTPVDTLVNQSSTEIWGFQIPDWLCDAGVAILAFATPLATMGMLACTSLAAKAEVNATNFMQTAALLGNAVKGTKESISGISQFSTWVKSTACWLLGRPDTSPKTVILQKLSELATSISEKNAVLVSDPSPALADRDFISSVETTLADVEKLFKDLSTREEHYQNALTILVQVREGARQLRSNYRTLMNNVAGKQEPCTIWIYGQSGVGKSKFVKHFVQELSKHHGRQLTMYTRCVTDNFWSGYCGQDICLYDDFGATKESVDHGELIQMFTEATFMPRVAELEKKGHTRFTSKYLIICSNFPTITQSKVVVTPEILERRRDFLYCVTSPMYDRYRQNGDMPPATEYRDDCSHLNFTRLKVFAMHNRANEFEPFHNYQNGRPVHTPVADVVGHAFLLQETRRRVYETELAQRLAAFRAGALTGPAPAFNPPPNQQAQVPPQGAFVVDDGALLDDDGPGGMDMLDVFDDLVDQALTQERPPVILFVGPPGIGKTQLAKSFSNFELRDEFTTLDDADFMVEVAQVFADDQNPGIAVPRIYTCNPELLEQRFLKLYTGEHLRAFKRRCVVFEFNFLRKSYFRGNCTTADLAAGTPYDNCVLITQSEYGGHPRPITLADAAVYIGDFKPVVHRIDLQDNLPGIDNFAPEAVFEFLEPYNENIQFSWKLVQKVRVHRGSILSLRGLFAGVMRLNLPKRVNTFRSAFIFLDRQKVPYTGGDFSFITTEGTFGFFSDEGVLRVCLTPDYDTTDIVPTVVNLDEIAILSASLPGFAWIDLLLLVFKMAVSVTSTVLMYQVSEPASLTSEAKGKLTWGEEMDLYDPPPVEAFGAKAVPKSALPGRPGITSSDGYTVKPASVKQIYSETNRKPEFTWATTTDESYELEQTLRKKDPKPVLTSEAINDPGALSTCDKVNAQTVPVLNAAGTPTCWAIGLVGRLFVTNYHCQKDGPLKIVYKDVQYPINIVAQSELRDHLFFTVPDQCPSVSDITCHLTSKTQTVRDMTGSFAILNVPRPNRVYLQRNVRLDAIAERSVEGIQRYGLGYRGTCTGYKYDPICTKRGDCGAPLVICNPTVTTKLLGFHSAASETYGVAALLYKEDLPILKNQSGSLTVLPHQWVKLYDEPKPVLERSFLVGECHNGEKQIRQYYPSRTKIFRSPFHGLRFGEPTEPAVLSRHDTRKSAEDVDPLLDALTKWDCEQVEPDNELMDEVFEELGLYFAVKVKQSGYRMKVLTKMESINGVSNIPGSNPIYRQTSPGYPFKCWKGVVTKARLFEQNDNLLQVISKSPEGVALNHCVDALIQAAREEKTTAVTFFGCLKDETRKLAKIYDVTTTRSIIACPIDYTLAHRMYFHTASAAITSLHMETPIRIGINPQSLSWHLLYHEHAKVSDRGFDVDYAGWDYHVSKHILKRIPRIYNAIYRMCDENWREEHDTVRTYLHSVMLEPLIIIGHQILRAPGGQPTGQPQTALDNSLANFAIFLYAYKKLVAGHPKLKPDLASFMEVCGLSFYGDDNITTVKPEFLDVLNFNTFAAEISKLGCKITSGAKDGSCEPSRNLKDLEFLKRRFVRLGKHWFGQLDRTSLNKMLDWNHCSASHHFDKDPDTVKVPEDPKGLVRQILLETAPHGPDLYKLVLDHVVDRSVLHNIDIEVMPYQAALNLLVTA